MKSLASIGFRASTRITVGRTHCNASLDLFNILNRSDINTLNTSYTTTSWLTPTQILVPRYAKFGVAIDF